jgi:hypothetical protein
MNAEMIQAGVALAGTALSFVFLLRARRLAVEMWSAKASSQVLRNGSDLACPGAMRQEVKGRER